jgi:hypothetical protein
MAAKEAEKPAKDAAKMNATIIRAFERKGYKNVVLFDRKISWSSSQTAPS